MDPVRYVKDVLQEGQGPLAEQLTCISRLRTLALAIGADKTKNELVPIFTEIGKEAEEASVDTPRRLADEVLTLLGEAIGGGFENFLPKGEAYQVFPALLSMCTIDETTVRAQAVASINALSCACTPDQIATHLAPTVVKLMLNDSAHPDSNAKWYCRVSACGLMAAAAKCEKAANKEELPTELRTCFEKCCQEADGPMVRREAARKMGDVAVAFASNISYVQDTLGTQYIKLCGETEQESIRVNAIKSSPAIFRTQSLQESNEVGKSFASCAVDKSWRVRIAVSHTLALVGQAIKEAKHPEETWKEEVSCATKLFDLLLKDSEAEVRLETAKQSAMITQVYGAELGKKVVPQLKELIFKDEQHKEQDKTRLELAETLMEMAGPLGPELARTTYLEPDDGAPPLVFRLLDTATETDTNVRLAVVRCLPGLVDVLGVDADVVTQLFGKIVELCTDKNWRVRWSAMMRIPEIAPHIKSKDKFTSTFLSEEGFLGLAKDNCARIRTDWVEVCAALGALYGIEFIIEHVLPTVIKSHEEPAYQQKMVLLLTMQSMGTLLGKDKIASDLLPKALAAAEDRVPNLRLMAVQTFASLAKNKLLFGKGLSDVSAKVTDMSKDEDTDVKKESTALLDSGNLSE